MRAETLYKGTSRSDTKEPTVRGVFVRMRGTVNAEMHAEACDYMRVPFSDVPFTTEAV